MAPTSFSPFLRLFLLPRVCIHLTHFRFWLHTIRRDPRSFSVHLLLLAPYVLQSLFPMEPPFSGVISMRGLPIPCCRSFIIPLPFPASFFFPTLVPILLLAPVGPPICPHIYFFFTFGEAYSILYLLSKFAFLLWAGLPPRSAGIWGTPVCLLSKRSCCLQPHKRDLSLHQRHVGCLCFKSPCLFPFFPLFQPLTWLCFPTPQMWLLYIFPFSLEPTVHHSYYPTLPPPCFHLPPCPFFSFFSLRD